MQVVCYMAQFGNWKQGCLEVFILINCIAHFINYFLPTTPVARQTFKLYESCHIISLVPNEPHAQWVCGSLPGGVKELWHEALR
jgi:hypothetical protein